MNNELTHTLFTNISTPLFHQPWNPVISQAPQGFLELPGFRGAFIGVSIDVLGVLEDKRPRTHRPSFEYLISLPTKTLKELWRTALLNQKKALIEAEGETGNELLKSINEEIASVDLVDTEKYDAKFKARQSAAAAPSAESKEE